YTFAIFSFPLPPTSEIYTLSLHDALPICTTDCCLFPQSPYSGSRFRLHLSTPIDALARQTVKLPGKIMKPVQCPLGELQVPLLRSEEHTSELQSRENLVCRLLLEKKKEH